jgi:7-carboxy-7-deazaguanine synthase
VTEPLQISELFYSIQGESTRAGLPCLFIRLAGCNLRCTYCDARYSWEEPAIAMTTANILTWVRQYPGILVEITGGEPLHQAGIYLLMQALIEDDRQVLLETNGSLPLGKVPETIGIIMDIKCPDSGMAARNLSGNIDLLKERSRKQCGDEIKFVLSSTADFHWARELVERKQLYKWLPVLFSPVRPLLAPKDLAQLLLDYRLKVRLQLQLHTLLWPDQSRGV